VYFFLYGRHFCESAITFHPRPFSPRPGTQALVVLKRKENVIRMKRLISLSLTVFCCVCLLVAMERRAYAYVDPGSGLMALQTAAAGLAAAGYYLRRRIAALFGRGKKPAASVVLSAPKLVPVRKDDSRNAA
jgi:hypothetical protein